MGRKAKVGDPRSGGTSGAGRDHWTACQSVLLAGGGVKGGQAFGATDQRAEHPVARTVARVNRVSGGGQARMASIAFP
jgi:hypothetical protein